MPDSIQPGENSKGGGWDDISRNSDGDLNLLNVNRNDDGQWLNTYYDNPSNQWNQTNGFAFVVSQLFLFLPYFLVREFCFVSCPFQPPSIRPMASIFPIKPDISGCLEIWFPIISREIFLWRQFF